MRKRSVLFPRACKQVRPSGAIDAFVNLPVRVAPGEKPRYERHYLGPYGSPEAAAEYARLNEAWRQNNGFVAPKRDILSVAGLCREFMAYCRTNYSPKSREPKKYFRALSQLVDFFGTEPAEKMGLLEIENFRNSLIRSDRYCRQEINARITRIKSALTWAAQRRIIPAAVVAEICLLKPIPRGRYRDNPKVKPVPIEHVLATLPYLSSTVAAMVRLQLITGCRPEEIRIMRPRDIDRELKNGCWRYKPAHHKTQRFSEIKIIPLNEAARAIIAEFSILLPDDSDEYIFRPVDAVAEQRRKKAENVKKPKTPSRAARDLARRKARREKFADCYSAAAYRRAIARAAKKAGVPHWFPYQLRHTSATEVRKRFGLEAAQILLGHKNPGTTLIYAEPDVAAAEKLAGKINDIY